MTTTVTQNQVEKSYESGLYLGKALKLIRIFHNLKQKELAENLDISRSHLSEIEAGRKTPSLELLQRYANFFEFPLWAIFAFKEFLEGNNQAKEFVENPLKNLNPKIKSMIDFTQYQTNNQTNNN